MNMLTEQMRRERDEYRRFLYEKSGGIVFDLLLLAILFVTVTTALFNMAAFYTSLSILAAAIIFKIAVYFFYSHFNP